MKVENQQLASDLAHTVEELNEAIYRIGGALDDNGRPLKADLLIAKANAQVAIANLKLDK